MPSSGCSALHGVNLSSVSKGKPCDVCGERVGCNSVQCTKCRSARIGSAWKNFRELSDVLVGKQGLSLKQRGKIYRYCVRPVLLYCCETSELAVAGEARLRGVECRIIRMMCGMRIVDRVSTDVLRDGWLLL